MSNGASHQPEINLLSRLLDATQRSYAEASDNWKLIETKAQATAAASGVFIAALFATILRDPLNLAGRVGVVLISAVFVAAFLLAVRSVLISEYQSPFESAANVADALRLVGQGDKPLLPRSPSGLPAKWASGMSPWRASMSHTNGS